MATVPPALWPYARTAANGIVGGLVADPSVVKAVAAQWIAENGWNWPPARNNPGNNSFTWAIGLHLPFCVEANAPNGTNPIVSFDTLDRGVASYAAGLLAFTRYADAVAKAAAYDGPGFLDAVASAGYGGDPATYAALLRSVDGQLPEPPAIVEKTTDYLRLRTGPGVTYPLAEKASMPPGTSVQLLRSTNAGGAYNADTTNTTRTDWLYVIDTRNGTKGWCAGAWVA